MQHKFETVSMLKIRQILFDKVDIFTNSVGKGCISKLNIGVFLFSKSTQAFTHQS